MKTLVAGFTVVYNAWLEAFSSVLPGWPRPAPQEPTPKAAQVAAVQEWEDEGGAIKPAVKKPDAAPAPKIPF